MRARLKGGETQTPDDVLGSNELGVLVKPKGHSDSAFVGELVMGWEGKLLGVQNGRRNSWHHPSEFYVRKLTPGELIETTE